MFALAYGIPQPKLPVFKSGNEIDFALLKLEIWNLLLVGCLIIVCYQLLKVLSPISIMMSLANMTMVCVGRMDWSAVMCEEGVEDGAEDTALWCVSSVPSMRLDYVWSSILTFWGLLLKKSSIHVHTKLSILSKLLSFWTCLWRITALKFKLKSTISILTVFLQVLIQVCKCCVESCDVYMLRQSVRSICKLVLVKLSRDGSFDIRENESLKAFGDYGGLWA